MLKEIRSVSNVPAAVGFGITPDQAAEISRTAEGVIVGSAVIKLIAKYGAHAGGHFIHLCAEDERGGQSQPISGSIHAAVSEKGAAWEGA